MKTDSLFYELFRRWPALALDLAGLDPAAAPRYVFRAEEIKQTAFRLDGLLAPAEDSDEPWVFVEVQFQPDDGLYRRLFAEIFLYLHRAPKARPWRALVLYPNIGIERVPLGYASLLDLPEVQRVDLGALRGHERPTPGWEILSMILDEPEATIARARRLLAGAATAPWVAETLDLLNLIETILVYKLPRCSREEVQVMLALTDIDLKQTRFYQDVHAEGLEEGFQKGRQEGQREGLQKGRQEGRQEGRHEGRQEGEAAVLLRLIQLKFGPPDQTLRQRIAATDAETLLRWSERILTAQTLDEVLAD
jgi:predicted transposase/invertase (TIGR01784 family)